MISCCCSAPLFLTGSHLAPPLRRACGVPSARGGSCGGGAPRHARRASSCRTSRPWRSSCGRFKTCWRPCRTSATICGSSTGCAAVPPPPPQRQSPVPALITPWTASVHAGGEVAARGGRSTGNGAAACHGDTGGTGRSSWCGGGSGRGGEAAGGGGGAGGCAAAGGGQRGERGGGPSAACSRGGGAPGQAHIAGAAEGGGRGGIAGMLRSCLR